MLVQYDGPSPAVEIEDTAQEAVRSVPLEVEDGVAKKLLQQSTWSKPKPAKTDKTKGGN